MLRKIIDPHADRSALVVQPLVVVNRVSMKESGDREVNLRNDRARNGERDSHGNCIVGPDFEVRNLGDPFHQAE